MAQDKHIKKHQDKLEKMREEVREQKMKILSKVDIDEILSAPHEHLRSIATDFYNSNEDKLKKAVEYLKGGGAITAIQTKYTVTPEQMKTLKNGDNG